MTPVEPGVYPLQASTYRGAGGPCERCELESAQHAGRRCPPRVLIALRLDADTARSLEAVVAALSPEVREVVRTVPELLRWLAEVAAEGAAQPLSWERAWLEQAVPIVSEPVDRTATSRSAG